MKDAKQILLAEDCPCTQVDCDKRGNCVACIAEHRRHKKHLPECMQDIIREQIRVLAEKVEFRVAEGRPE